MGLPLERATGTHSPAIVHPHGLSVFRKNPGLPAVHLPQLRQAHLAHPDLRRSVHRQLERVITGHHARHAAVIEVVTKLPAHHPDRGASFVRFVEKDMMVIESLAHAREMARLGNQEAARTSIEDARQRLSRSDFNAEKDSEMLALIDQFAFYVDFAYGATPPETTDADVLID